jgi:hypothetical protein
VAVLAGVAVFVLLGVWIHYNLRTAARFVPQQAADQRAARYEREFKQYERLPQPRVAAVALRVDLFPERGEFTASGTYRLVNRTASPMPAVHVMGDPGRPFQWMRDVSFDRATTEALHDAELRYHVYQFAEPLAPGEAVTMSFRVGRDRPPFDASVSIVGNGTFLGADAFPAIGYRRDRELRLPARRRELGLAPSEDLPAPDDAWPSRNLFTTTPIDLVQATVAAPDQIAVARLSRARAAAGGRVLAYDDRHACHALHTFLSALCGRPRSLE